ncbi:MAG: hypothetical protein JW771_07925 [Candidatus Thermoplasmatota archaeon]|nr:hypothetical protein [Candidatus Thermoplasmatota archaeon]
MMKEAPNIRYFFRELIPARERQNIPMARNIMKYRMFTEQEKSITKDNTSIATPMADAIA